MTMLPFQIWLNGDNFQVGLVDAADSPWREFHITDHMVAEDAEVLKFFG